MRLIVFRWDVKSATVYFAVLHLKAEVVRINKLLTHRTSFEALAQSWGGRMTTLNGPGAQRWAALKTEIQKYLANGGELWE